MLSRESVTDLIVKYPPSRRLLEWWEHKRTNAYLLSYPKCGRTWLRLMIGKAIEHQFQLQVPDPMDLAAMSERVPSVPRIRVRHEFRWFADTAIETTKQQFRDKSVVFLVRDPRDVVVSMYFNATKRQHLNDDAQRQYMFTGDLAAFLRQPGGVLEQLVDYYNVWAENRSVPRRFCLVRYEDLHADPNAAMRIVLDTLGVRASTKAVDHAVEFGRFENMRALEKTNAFGSHRLRAADTADADSFKTRQGKVGGYRQYFSDADVAYANELIDARLSRFYAGYRSL